MNYSIELSETIISKLSQYIHLYDYTKIKNELNNLLSDYNIRRVSTLSNTNSHNKVEMFLLTKKLEGLCSGSLKIYEYKLQDFFNYVKINPEDVVKSDVMNYIDYKMISKHSKESTIATTIGILRSFFKWMYEEELINRNPMIKIKQIKYDKKILRKALTNKEFEKFRNACIDNREKAIVEFYYSTGCRLSEVVGIKIKDIDFTTRSVEVIGKGNKRRKVLFSIKAELFVENYLKTRKGTSEYLFIGMNKPYNQLHQRSIEMIMRRIAQRAEIRNVCPHLIRHTYASNALNTGMSIYVLQKSLGHTSLNSTEIYTEINDSTMIYEHNKYVL